MTERRARVLVLGAVAVLVGYYFLWQARAATGPFAWHGDKNGFYNLLARGFLSGHLYTTIPPRWKLYVNRWNKIKS